MLNQLVSSKASPLSCPLNSIVAQAGEVNTCLRTSQSLGHALLTAQHSEELQALLPCRYDPSIHSIQDNQAILKYLHPEGVSFSVVGQMVQNQGRSQYAAIKNWSDGTSHVELRQTADETGSAIWMLPKHLGLKGGGPTARVDVSNQFTITHDQSSGSISIEYEPLEYEHLLKAIVDTSSHAMSFNILASANHRTSLGSGKDMFIGLMSRLAREQIEVREIRGKWLSLIGSSVNASKYQKNRRMGLSETAAAAKTWTGRMVAEYGFHPVSVSHRSGNFYTVIFKK